MPERIIIVNGQTRGCHCHPEPCDFENEVFVDITPEEAEAEFIRLHERAGQLGCYAQVYEKPEDGKAWVKR